MKSIIQIVPSFEFDENPRIETIRIYYKIKSRLGDLDYDNLSNDITVLSVVTSEFGSDEKWLQVAQCVLELI